MANILRQSTQIEVRVGPFVDATDAVTPETGITLGAADQAELLKEDGATTVDISGATWSAITGSDGWYDLTLTTSHTDTVGELVVVIQDASVCLPVFARFQVVEEAIYDALYAASATGALPATLVQGGINTAAGTITTLDGLDTAQDTQHGTTQTAIGNLNDLSAAQVNAEVDTALADIHLDHIFATTYDPASKPGTADALWNEIIENDGGVSRLTANALEQAPTGGSAPSAADIRAEIDSNSTQLAAIVADTNELQTDWTNGGRLDLIIDELTTQGDTNEGKIDTIDGIVDAILVDTGTTLPATLTTIEGKVDTVDTNVDAVLVDTGTTLPARFDGIEGATFDTATDSLEAIRNNQSAGSGLSLSDAISDGQTAGTVGKALENALDFLDTAVSGVGGTAGAGDTSVTITVTIDSGNEADIAVWVTNTTTYSDVVAGTLYTNDSSQVTFLLDTEVQYYLWADKSGSGSIQASPFYLNSGGTLVEGTLP